MDYTQTIYNVPPAPQRTGITNNILPYYVDYNVMLFSRGHFLPMNNLLYSTRFNGYCVHADCRETLVPQAFWPSKLGIYEIKQQPEHLLLFVRKANCEAVADIISRFPGRAMLNAASKPYLAIKLRKNENIRKLINNIIFPDKAGII